MEVHFMNDAIEKVLLLGGMCLVMLAVMYLLYLNGWMILSSKRAVSFVGSRGGRSASFSGCSGSIRRIVRFSESRMYTVSLDSALTKGTMTAALLDPDKKEILCLTSDQPSAVVEIQAKKRYTLVLRFRSATGRYELSWV